jgi:hypothetical protein
MTFSLRRKRRITPRHARRTPTAAMTSLFAVLALAGHSPAQDWQPTGQGKPQQLPPTVQKVGAVQQFQPPPPTPLGKLPDPITRVSAQMKNRTGEDTVEFPIRIEPPGIHELTQRNSEDQFFQKLIDEGRLKPGSPRVYFPEHQPVSTRPYAGRQFAAMPKIIEPNYVCHKPLLFEQKNFERYGWDLGPATPAVNIGMFYYDLVMLPYHLGSNACRCYDCSAGKCLPGDPTPLLLYHERFSVTGMIFETTVVGGLFFAFP